MKDLVKKSHTIGIKLRLSYASERDLLYGISSYAYAHCRWNLRLLSPTEEGFDPSDSDLNDLDGVITSKPIPQRNIAYNGNVPIVVIGTRDKWLGRRMTNLTFVRNDDRDIGRLGGEFLHGLGNFRAFGYVPTANPFYYSVLRGEGFRMFLKASGVHVEMFSPSGFKDGSHEDIVNLSNWLKQLPKPAAILAVHDLRATHVLAAANAASIGIPDQISLLGVDNDELLCDFTHPKLSSIFPDHVYEGRLAAQELERMLLAGTARRRTKTVRTQRKSLVERESTVHTSPAARLAEIAVDYIHRNALTNIRVRDVVKHLGVSHRLANLRFRECTGTTILEAILNVRLEEVKRRLRTSNVPINKITAACGFGNDCHAKHLFRKRFGMTMRDFRKSQQADNVSSPNRPGGPIPVRDMDAR